MYLRNTCLYCVILFFRPVEKKKGQLHEAEEAASAVDPIGQNGDAGGSDIADDKFYGATLITDDEMSRVIPLWIIDDTYDSSQDPRIIRSSTCTNEIVSMVISSPALQGEAQEKNCTDYQCSVMNT